MMEKNVSDINKIQLQALQKKMNFPIDEVGIEELEKSAMEAGLSVRDYITEALKEYGESTK